MSIKDKTKNKKTIHKVSLQTGNEFQSLNGVCRPARVQEQKKKDQVQHFGPSFRRSGEKGLTDLTERPGTIRAELWEGRANEAVGAFIIFTEDWD